VAPLPTTQGRSIAMTMSPPRRAMSPAPGWSSPVFRRSMDALDQSSVGPTPWRHSSKAPPDVIQHPVRRPWAPSLKLACERIPSVLMML